MQAGSTRDAVVRSAQTTVQSNDSLQHAEVQTEDDAPEKQRRNGLRLQHQLGPRIATQLHV